MSIFPMEIKQLYEKQRVTIGRMRSVGFDKSYGQRYNRVNKHLALNGQYTGNRKRMGYCRLSEKILKSIAGMRYSLNRMLIKWILFESC
jgi:hypothetical protein